MFAQSVPLLPAPVKKPKCTKTIRNDIQLLRFLAIAAVLGFHLRPKTIPQGYLGVDIFFVISGYLMTVVTASSKGVISVATVTNFYERRLKRLCPVYLLTVLATLAVGSVLLVQPDFASLQTDSAWALVFGSNIQAILKEDDYFKFGSDYKFLLHTWSLSVEMQFYAVAPFILAIVARSYRPLLACSVLIVFSLAFQSLISSPVLSFECVISRIWQFLIGTFVFYMEKQIDPTIKRLNTSKPFVASLILVVLLLAPEFSAHVAYKVTVRVVGTLLTGFIMYYATAIDEITHLKPLTRVLTLIGDASYSIYLVHWPMIRFAEYFEILVSTDIYIQIGCILTVSLIQFYVYEKPLTSFTTRTTFVICGVFYFFAALLILPNFVIIKESTNVTDASLLAMDPVLGNTQIERDCRVQGLVDSLNCLHVPELDAVVPKTKAKGAIFCGIKGPGKWTIFVAGNSFAQYQIKAVKNALEDKFKMIYFVARPGCLAFDSMNDLWKSKACDEIIGITEKILKAIKPDIVVIIQRIDNNGHILSGKVGNITTVKHLENEFANYSKYTKKIFVTEPNAIASYSVPNALVKALKLQLPIDNFFVTLNDFKNQTEPGMNQVVAAMKSCPKCEPIWIRQNLCDDEKCYFYDRTTKLALYCDSNHMSAIGNDLIMPAYRAAFEKGFQELRRLSLS
uniref:Acyl_transf_3 domain-containing protein n=2 Tax=Panagrellus redivivus TaxID=6233 RepID=A0A7E4V8T6_PANRE